MVLVVAAGAVRFGLLFRPFSVRFRGAPRKPPRASPPGMGACFGKQRHGWGLGRGDGCDEDEGECQTMYVDYQALDPEEVESPSEVRF